jgi:class 3 adenylate cyclase/predicted ATPase
LSPPRADGAERRQLTVMFCDLVGSTALASCLDPEDLRDVIGTYQKCAAEVIGRFDGFVAKYMGDGVLAYFGYPQAHEDDAERAVRVGLALIEAVAALETAASGPLQVRVGIATGLVVVGDLIGHGAAQEQAVVGETPNLASRLQALAESGTVIIAPSTRRLTGGLFDYEDLGAVQIKGFAAPVTPSRVLRESAAESRFEARHGPDLTPLVDREVELELLQRRWRQATRGEGCVVLVSGEPGIGKSRLAQTLLDRLGDEPYTRLRFFCSPHHRDHALYPTIAQLERVAGLRHEDPAGRRLDKLEAVLAQAIRDPREATSLLAALLSLPTDQRYPPLTLAPQKLKEKTLQALVAQVEGLAAQRPVLRLFEDAQWSDPTSLELLDMIIDRVPALPVMMIVTFRPEFIPPWTGRRHVALLSLNRLAPRHRAEMIVGVIGGKVLPKKIADQIVARTDGVPLFVEELTKSVIESGMLTDMGDRYAAAGPVPVQAIPATLQASLLARLDRLAPVREVAQIGAALGRRFSHELITAVAAMPQRQLDDALAQLVRAELIYRRGTPPNAEYTFKHALVQDAAYSTLLRSRRKELHARIAETLEGQFPEIATVQPALVAHHCEEAGLAEKAVEHWLAAGRQAWGRSMLSEAVSLLRHGLALIPGMPNSDWRREREFDLQIALGQALVESQGYSARDAGEAYARARQLSLALERPRSLLLALWGQWAYHVCRADLELARQLASEMRDLGEAGGDVPTRVLGCDASGFTCTDLGEFIPGRAYLAQSLALYDPAHRLFYTELLPNDALVQLQVYLSFLLVCVGDLDQAMFQRDAALQEARRLSHPHDLAIALAFAWITGRCVAWDPKSLCQCADELVLLSVEYELGFYRAVGLAMRGWCVAAQGQADEGIGLLTTGLAGMYKAGFMLYRPWFLTLLADACRMAGQLQTALDHLIEARRLAEETQERWAQTETFRLRGHVLLAMGDQAAAEASYDNALAIARQQSAKLWELCAAMSLARLWCDQGKRTEAHQLLAPVYGWFTEGFDTPHLKEAKALLDELG